MIRTSPCSQTAVLRPAQTLASVAAMLQDAPTFRNREGNFAADPADDGAPADGALPALPSGDGDTAAGDDGNVQVLTAITC